MTTQEKIKLQRAMLEELNKVIIALDNQQPDIKLALDHTVKMKIILTEFVKEYQNDKVG